MQLLKWFSLLKEIVMCNNNLRHKSPLRGSTDHKSLLKHHNIDFEGGGVTAILNLIFRRVE